jgi:hypothetical protein
MPFFSDKEKNPISVKINRIPAFVKYVNNAFLFDPSDPAKDLG